MIDCKGWLREGKFYHRIVLKLSYSATDNKIILIAIALLNNTTLVSHRISGVFSLSWRAVLRQKWYNYLQFVWCWGVFGT